MDRSKVEHPVYFNCNGPDKVEDGEEIDKAESKEETEFSSSFEDSDSGIENPESDYEVASYVPHDRTSDLSTGIDDFVMMRRKKLTIQWKTFIQPLMWRCKWLELQIKKCNAQASKYERELAAYDVEKQFIMFRKKRRKIEDTEDIASYMSNHNLFSYDGKHSRAVNGARMGIQEKINGDHGFEAVDTSWLQSMDEGDVLLENMLRKLDSLRSKVNNLRSRMHKVTSENAEKNSLVDDLDLVVASSNELSSRVQSLNITPELLVQNDNSSVGMKEEVNDIDETLGSCVLDEFDLVNEDQPTIKMGSMAKLTAPKGKKKRGKRKRGSSSRWSRRS